MPPLLPEYLSQPVKIIVETPSAESWPVWVGAAATLCGAALGAWLGAKGAYRAAEKASKAEFRRQGLKEALYVADQIDLDVLKFVGSIIGDASGVSDGGAARIKETSQLIDLSLTIRLRSLLKLHHKELSDKANSLHTTLFTITVLASKADALLDEWSESPLVTQGLSFQTKLSDIRELLRSELDF